MKRILEQEKGVQKVFHKDHDGIVTIEKKQDVTKILEANKFQRDHAPMRHTSEVMNHKARIPVVAVEEWCKVRGIKYAEFMQNREHLRHFLNDPDNAHWLTRKGKV